MALALQRNNVSCLASFEIVGSREVDLMARIVRPRPLDRMSDTVDQTVAYGGHAAIRGRAAM